MEEWKEIENYGYSVSSYGNVKNDRTGRLKKPLRDKDGYCYVRIYKDGRPNFRRIHRLVGQAFIDNPEDKPCINHIDGNKANNNVCNLEWVTQSENMLHAYSTGLAHAQPTYGMLGKKNPNGGRKGRVVMIVETSEIFNSVSEAASITGVSDTSIYDCLNHKTRTTRVGTFVYV